MSEITKASGAAVYDTVAPGILEMFEPNEIVFIRDSKGELSPMPRREAKDRFKKVIHQAEESRNGLTVTKAKLEDGTSVEIDSSYVVHQS